MAGNRGTVLLAAVCVLAVLVVACSGGFVSGSAHGGLALRSVQENRGTDASATAHRMAPATLSLRGGTSKRSGWSKRHEPDSDAMSVEEDDEGSSSYSSRYNDNEDSSSEASDAGSKRRHAGKHKVTKKHDSVSEEDSRSDSRHSGDEDSHESASESHSQHPHSHSDSEDSRDDRDDSESSSSEPPRRCHRRKGGKAMKDESEHEDHESHSQGQSHDEDRSEESHSHDSEEEHSHSHSEEDGRSHSDDSSTRSDESRLDETEDESRQGEDDMSGDDDRDMLQDGTQMKRLALAGAEARELATMGEGRELSETLQGRTFIIERDNHADSLLSGFEILRRRADDASTAGKSFCDIIVDAGGVQVHAHKAVLASISPELETIMSSAGKTGVVKLHGVDPRGLQGAISYIYNGSVEVSPMDLPSVLKAAEVLAVRPLKDACIEHLLEDLSVSTPLQKASCILLQFLSLGMFSLCLLCQPLPIEIFGTQI